MVTAASDGNNPEEASSNVKVVVRIRPLIAREKISGATESIHSINNEIYAGPDGKCFTFDQCFPSTTGQEILFTDTIEPLIESFIKGYNCTVFAYGQTGSGKTFTMGTDCSNSTGMIPLAINKIFTLIQGLNAIEHEIKVSFLELYNEELIDLLNPQVDRQKRAMLAIREDNTGGIFITGLKEENVKNYNQVMSLLEKGSLCRITKSTEMNATSSRSHAIFTILLRQQQQQQQQGEGEGEDGNDSKWLISKIHFVDLAGSERLKRTNAVGIRVKESISINSGLLALGNVISALGDETNRNKNVHIPYRDSKLTRLLQDALGGNCHTLMVACISPSSEDLNETVNTLKYAYRARSIHNRATLNVSQGNEASLQWENLQLRKEISQLKRELIMVKSSLPRRSVEERDTNSTNSLWIVEKKRLEEENDSLRALLNKNGNSACIDHVGQISELKAKLMEKRGGGGSGTFSLSVGQFPSSPDSHNHNYSHHGHVQQQQYPPWMEESKRILEKSRAQLAKKLIELSMNEDEDKDRDKDNIKDEDSFSSNVEELISQLEQCQSEYITMKFKYEERLKLMQENFVIAQKERDLAIKANSNKLENQNPKINRERYEERIKQLGREVNELKNKLALLSKSSTTKTITMEQTIKNLRINLSNSQSEKQKLTFKQEHENKVTSKKQMELDNEITILRAKERTCRQVVDKQRKSLEFQTKVMQKQNQKIELLRLKIKQLVLNNRKVRIGQTGESMNFDSPSWKVAFVNNDTGGRERSNFSLSGSMEQSLGSTISNPNLSSREMTAVNDDNLMSNNDMDITVTPIKSFRYSMSDSIGRGGNSGYNSGINTNNNSNTNNNNNNRRKLLSMSSTIEADEMMDSDKEEQDQQREIITMIATTPPVNIISKRLSNTPIMSSHKSFFTRLADKATHSLRIPKSPSKTRLQVD